MISDPNRARSIASLQKEEDRLRPIAKKILEKIEVGKLKVYASTTTIKEIIPWFYSRQMLDELVKAVNAPIHLKIEWVKLTPEIYLIASLLMNVSSHCLKRLEIRQSLG
ncbi:MAG: hypothetical protein QW176_05615 [Candidatus Bathyarchaeia archaeon]